MCCGSSEMVRRGHPWSSWPVACGSTTLRPSSEPSIMRVSGGALEACDVFVFPTMSDFSGRVAVEALTAGVPVVVSPMTGAAGTIVQDGINGIVVDPRDTNALAAALHRAVDPQRLPALRAGVQRMNASLMPDAAAEVILRAVKLARRRPTAGERRGSGEARQTTAQPPP